MSKKTNRIYLLYLLLTPLSALATVTLRTVALLTAYDAAIGFYTARPLAIATASILAAVTLFLAFFTYEMRDLFVFSVDYRDVFSLSSGVFLAFMLIFFGVSLFIGGLSGSTLLLVLALLSALAAIGGAFAFGLRAFDARAEGRAKAITLTLLSYLGIFFSCYLTLEGTLFLNSPPKLLAIPTWITITFFLLGEARIALSRAKWSLHTYITVITVLFTATLSLPNLVYHAKTGSAVLGNTAHDFVVFGFFLFALARLFATFFSAKRQETAAFTAATTPSGAPDDHSEEEKE